MSEQNTIVLDQKSKKLLRLARVAARLARDRENYRQAMKALVKTIPKETRSAVAKYVAALRVATRDPSPENFKVLGELAVQKQLLINSWRAERREERRLVSEIAKRFYASLDEVAKITRELEQEFSEELTAEVE